MSIYVPVGFPHLKLVFSADESYPYLLGASFWKVKGHRANTKLVDAPPGDKFLSAICILILLAKYQDQNPEKPDDELTFLDERKCSSWLNTLGKDKYELDNLFTIYFDGIEFFSSRRITEKTRAKSNYYPDQLRLENVKLFKRDVSSSDDERVLLKRSELVKKAKSLEKYGLEKGVPWELTVQKHADRIDSKGGQDASKRKKAAPARDESSSSCVCSPDWLNLFDESLKEIEGQEIGGKWYVVCGTPLLMLAWRKIFCEAVILHGAKLNFAYHAATGPDSCISMQAQWRMNTEHLKDPNPIEMLKQRLRDSTAELRAWAEKAKAKKAKGSMEFFESFITHPFTSVLIVPESSKGKFPKTNGAPKGTICLLGFYTFYPRSLEDRLGICLRQPSPLLDIYYNSITRFFEQGPKDGYLKLVDLSQYKSKSG